jgi:hypothetical protein
MHSAATMAPKKEQRDHNEDEAGSSRQVALVAELERDCFYFTVRAADMFREAGAPML